MSIPLSFLIKIASSPVTWILFFFGLIVGSFLNVCIYRIPKKIFLSKSRSFCPHCQKKIPWFHNFPLISYLILKGKSQCCHQKISLQYPLVELFTGILFVVLYWKFPFVTQIFGFFSLEEQQLTRFLYAVLAAFFWSAQLSTWSIW